MTDTPWLREMVEEELEELFSPDKHTVQRSVQRILDRLPFDRAGLDADLIEALQISVDEHNDDTDASLWIALILGQAGITRAIPILIHCLGNTDDDEMRQASGVALLKMGPSGLEQLLAYLEEEEPSIGLSVAAYEILPGVTCLDDPELTARVIEFLRERVELDAGRPGAARLIEQAAAALARLGDRHAIASLEKLLSSESFANNGILEDALDMLQENEKGLPISYEVIPGSEDFEWLFDFEPDATRKRDEANSANDEDLGSFVHGIGGE